MQEAEPVTADTNLDTEQKIAGRFHHDLAAQSADDRAQAEPAGEPSVDALIARLDGLDGLPLEEHVAVFDDTHDGLRQVLSELDAAPGPRPGEPTGPAGPAGPGGR